MNKQFSHETKNTGETLALGRKIAKKLTGGEVFGLIGELGSGKTVFVKGAALGLGIRTNIQSPTFILKKEYPVKNKRIKRLIHIDLYRLKRIGVKDLEFLEGVGDKQSATFIEWPKRMQFQRLEGKKRYITIIIKDENTRVIRIKPIC